MIAADNGHPSQQPQSNVAPQAPWSQASPYPPLLPFVFPVYACHWAITPCIIDATTTSITTIPVLGNVDGDTKLHH